MAEPTREQMAQDYAKALEIIDRLRRERDDLRTALELVSLRRVMGELCWCAALPAPPHSTACGFARAALAKVDGTS